MSGCNPESKHKVDTRRIIRLSKGGDMLERYLQSDVKRVYMAFNTTGYQTIY
jgi:hypothetical protein